MRKHSKFMEVARNFWPGGHSRYEEMSALAATGQLGGAQMYELNAHIAQCSSCRSFLESVAQLSVQALPLLADSTRPSPDVALPEGMRARFFSRLATAKSSEVAPVLEFVPGLDKQRLVVAEGKREEKTRGEKLSAGGGPRFGWSVAAACVALMIGIGAFTAGVNTRTAGLQIAAPTGPIVSSSVSPEPVARINSLEQQKAELQNRLADLQQKLLNARLEQDSLTNELAAAKARLAEVSTQTQRESALTQARSQEQTASLQSQIERLNRRLADSDVRLGVQLQTTEELTARLEATQNELQRTRDLNVARSDAGDLVAARNLHIIDVYDADNKGNRQRSYGRVFYVEGKSLIFYAYDLQDSGRFNTNVVFRVWGEKAGTKETTHNLGILHNDDASEKRWAMTFDDPKVLTQINSVFVTVESGSRHSDAPRGKKILYAYFGSQANHP